MGISSQEPGKTGQTGIAEWKYLSIEVKESVGAFIAGKPFGVYCHEVKKRSKPCRLITSDGALPCPLCNGRKPVWRGYTPLYDSEYCWRFVCITEEYRESVSELIRFTQVRVSRGKMPTLPPVIRPHNWRTLPIPEHPSREAMPNLLPSLLTLWGDDALSAWHYSSDIPVSIAPIPGGPRAAKPVPPAEESPRITAEVRRRIKWPGKDEPGAPGPQLIGDVLDHVPGGNGKPKPR